VLKLARLPRANNPSNRKKAAEFPAAFSLERNFMITTVLFDLDGTLLPMELDGFLERYFELLIGKMSAHGYDARTLTDAMWDGVNAMIGNDGRYTNEEVFLDAFSQTAGRDIRADMHLFQQFYENEFHRSRGACGFDPEAVKTVRLLKAKGLRTVLATNPLYHAIATESRIRWAGLEPSDFELYTTYEDTFHCKPNPAYYLDILEKLGLKPEECLMVGNDAIEDMVAATVGIHVFLMPKYLVNRKKLDISPYPQGDWDDLLRYIDTL
jgi:HAD superfamily hydrolase (TIGR01509 family)